MVNCAAAAAAATTVATMIAAKGDEERSEPFGDEALDTIAVLTAGCSLPSPEMLFDFSQAAGEGSGAALLPEAAATSSLGVTAASASVPALSMSAVKTTAGASPAAFAAALGGSAAAGV